MTQQTLYQVVRFRFRNNVDEVVDEVMDLFDDRSEAEDFRFELMDACPIGRQSLEGYYIRPV